MTTAAASPGATADGKSDPGARCYAVVSGGGTGGHVQPALAVAEALVARGQPLSAVHFVGSRRGMEGRLVPEAGFEVTLLPGRGLKRSFHPSNIGAATGLVVASVRALGVLHRLKPAVVVTVGGYAGFPAAFAAVLRRVPVVVVSYDAAPGAVNKFIGRFAAANAVAYAGSELKRARVTGPPVRGRVLAIERSPAARAEACRSFGIDPERLLLLVTTGSLGARRVNEATVEMCRQWSDRTDLTVYHVAGDRDLEEMRRAAAAARLGLDGGGLDYRLTGYEPRLPGLLAAADLMVARAGASTVAEIAAIGIPSVLVPLPGAPADHQTKNAKALEAVGAAVVLADADCDGPTLAGVVDPLLQSPELRSAMAESAASLGHRDAADQIALLAMAVARGRAK